jgi:SAM-dependent methyltransferase
MEWFENEDFWRDLYPWMFSAERFAAAKDEVSRIIALTQCTGGKLLDLCCGPGRHAVGFAQRGFQVTAVDRSEFFLDKARKHASEAGASVEWVRQDMRHFVRPGEFDLVCNLFTSFGYFSDPEEDLAVLRNIHQSLKDAGVLVMDVIGKEKLARKWQDTLSTEMPDGSLLVQRQQLRDDWSRICSEWTLIKDGHARNFSFEHTIYSGRELKDRIVSSGFKQVQLFGDLLGSPYGLTAERLVAVGRK